MAREQNNRPVNIYPKGGRSDMDSSLSGLVTNSDIAKQPGLIYITTKNRASGMPFAHVKQKSPVRLDTKDFKKI